MELERPGEEKNKRWEAKMVAKSSGESVSSESSEEAEKKSTVERVRDLEAVGVESDEVRSERELKFLMMVEVVGEVGDGRL
jgi:hypothetical protein